jgi:hypothetical protein
MTCPFVACIHLHLGTLSALPVTLHNARLFSDWRPTEHEVGSVLSSDATPIALSVNVLPPSPDRVRVPVLELLYPYGYRAL